MCPQPKDESICIMRRYYSTLKRDNSFKKRTTWFEKMPQHDSSKLNIAIVEYLGKFPKEGSSHGNRKTSNCDYVRSTKCTRDIIKERIKDS